ncbi:MAG: hypothetical protein ACOC6H_00715 [Thermoproteota archaeon]
MEREKEEKEKKQEEETLDIYRDEQREEMLKEDEITAVEGAFMRGRDLEVKRKGKKDLMLEERDTKSVELAKEEYQED